MFQENEVVSLLIGLGALVFLLANLPRLRRGANWQVLFGGFCVYLAARVLTVLEGVFWPAGLNVLEHFCYAGSAVLLAAWCWLSFGRRRAGHDPGVRG